MTARSDKVIGLLEHWWVFSLFVMDPRASCSFFLLDKACHMYKGIGWGFYHVHQTCIHVHVCEAVHHIKGLCCELRIISLSD